MNLLYESLIFIMLKGVMILSEERRWWWWRGCVCVRQIFQALELGLGGGFPQHKIFNVNLAHA